MQSTIEILSGLGVVPVVVIEKPEVGEQVALALIEGSLPCTEVTFRTDVASAVIA